MKAEMMREISNTAWAIQPQALTRFMAAINAGIEARDESSAIQSQKGGNVGIINVSGVIMPKETMWSRYLGVATCEGLSRALKTFANDESVSVIVLNMDTPGGSVAGVDELTEQVRALQGIKKVVAVSNSLMASAGYYIASAADEIVATPSSETGAIGVFTTHFNYSKMLDEAGLDITLIQAGEYKTEGNPYQPLSDEAKSYIQSVVDQYYNQFINSVAKGRGIKPAAVRDNYGKGRVFTAKDALAAGMVDRIETMDQVISRLTSSKRAQSPRRRMQAEVRLLEVS